MRLVINTLDVKQGNKLTLIINKISKEILIRLTASNDASFLFQYSFSSNETKNGIKLVLK